MQGPGPAESATCLKSRTLLAEWEFGGTKHQGLDLKNIHLYVLWASMVGVGGQRWTVVDGQVTAVQQPAVGTSKKTEILKMTAFCWLLTRADKGLKEAQALRCGSSAAKTIRKQKRRRPEANALLVWPAQGQLGDAGTGGEDGTMDRCDAALSRVLGLIDEECVGAT